MIIGVPTEIKNHEYRVGLVPASVQELTHRQHEVIIQSGAGKGIGFSDEDYVSAGAVIVDSAHAIFANADLVVKVKEPLACERALLNPNQVLFTYLHLAPDVQQTQELLDAQCVAIAYETVTSPQGTLPLLAPMSEVAGRMSIQAGAHCLEKAQGGRGTLLAGVPGVSAGRVVIIGGGVVGRNAAHMALGLGAQVTLLDNNLETLRRLDQQFDARIQLIYSTYQALFDAVTQADLVIGAVLIPGAAAPKLVTKHMLKHMKPGAVVVDVAIDQGGCFETSSPTTHQEPTYIVDDIVHYCVANMPGAVARTASIALNNATLPYVLRLADLGWKEALRRDAHFLQGLNICQGSLTYQPVAEAQGLDWVAPNLSD